MQLGGSTIPLLPAVAVGVAVVLAGLVLWGVSRVRRSPGAVPQPARSGAREDPEPDARDWTGEGAAGAADPPRPARRLTVADVVAARGADTEPMAAVAVATPPTAWGAGPAPDRPESSADEGAGVRPGPPPAAEAPPARPGRIGQHRLVGDVSGPDPGDAPGGSPSPGEPAAQDEADRPGTEGDLSSGAASGPVASVGEGSAWSAFGTGESAPARSDGTGETTAPEQPDVATHGVVPDLDEDTDGPESVGTGPVPPPWSPARTAPAAVSPETSGQAEPETPGQAEPVSFAVQQALAARAVQRARGRPDVPDLAADDVAPSLPDARDRLLAVLLADPVTALGATTELDDTQARIETLGDVLRRRRADLATAVHRLHASGLTGDQIGRLAGLDCDDVREILEQPSGEGSGGR